MTNTKKPSPPPPQDISDPHEFFRQGLGPGYAEEEFGPGDKVQQRPEEPPAIRNWRGDRYSRFDRPGQKNPGIAPKR